MSKLIKIGKKMLVIFRRPAVHLSFGFLALGGFIAGVVFWGAFNTAMELTNTDRQDCP